MKAIIPSTLIYTPPSHPGDTGSLYIGGGWEFNAPGSPQESAAACFAFVARSLQIPLQHDDEGPQRPTVTIESERAALDAIAIARWKESS